MKRKLTFSEIEKEMNLVPLKEWDTFKGGLDPSTTMQLYNFSDGNLTYFNADGTTDKLDFNSIFADTGSFSFQVRDSNGGLHPYANPLSPSDPNFDPSYFNKDPNGYSGMDEVVLTSSNSNIDKFMTSIGLMTDSKSVSLGAASLYANKTGLADKLLSDITNGTAIGGAVVGLSTVVMDYVKNGKLSTADAETVANIALTVISYGDGFGEIRDAMQLTLALIQMGMDIYSAATSQTEMPQTGMPVTTIVEAPTTIYYTTII